MPREVIGLRVFEVSDVTNREFLDLHGAAGRIGLTGGSSWIDRRIRRSLRRARNDRKPSDWSHAFLFSGRRADGQHWVLESDLEIHKKHVRLGVQENRAGKYHDRTCYPNLAVLDFGLAPYAVTGVLAAGLDLLAGQTRYSLRELVGTLLALARPTLRARDNLLAREGSIYCSALIQHCYEAAGVDFAPAVHRKNTTPEDIAATAVPHTAWVLRRDPETPPPPR